MADSSRRRLARHRARVARYPVRADESQVGYAWSTPVSAAFYAAIIIVALILAKLLAPLIDLAPR